MRALMTVFTAACLAVQWSAAPVRADQQGAATFALDPVHSSIVFSIGHLGIARVHGKFTNPAGIYRLDFDNPSASMIEVSVKAESVNTGNQKRDDHLRSADFFNVEQFPSISFVGRSFEKTGADEMTVVGDLTLLAQTRPVEVHLTFLGEGDTPQGYKSGLEATFRIRRSEFGMTNYLKGNAVGDEVRLTVALEGKRRDENVNP